MKLAVKFLKGNTIEIDCDYSWTLSQLMEAVKVKADLKPEFFLARTTSVYNSWSSGAISLRTLPATLEELDINSDSIITCIMKPLEAPEIYIETLALYNARTYKVPYDRNQTVQELLNVISKLCAVDKIAPEELWHTYTCLWSFHYAIENKTLIQHGIKDKSTLRIKTCALSDSLSNDTLSTAI